eukprot:18156-Heterococcus_DN1.PRE.3
MQGVTAVLACSHYTATERTVIYQTQQGVYRHAAALHLKAIKPGCNLVQKSNEQHQRETDVRARAHSLRTALHCCDSLTLILQYLQLLLPMNTESACNTTSLRQESQQQAAALLALSYTSSSTSSHRDSSHNVAAIAVTVL